MSVRTKATVVRRDRLYREAVRALDFCAIAAFGIEDGPWLKIAITTDVDGAVAVGQAHHPTNYRAQLIYWATDRIFADQVRDELIDQARKRRMLLNRSFVAASVANCRLLIEEAAAEVGVELITPEAYERAINRWIAQR